MSERLNGRPRPGLDRDVVVQTAIEIVEAEGVNALSMRRLGSALGVEAMALYRYVDGRDDLLDAIVEKVTAAVERSADMDLGPRGGWQAYLQGVAHAVRDSALRYPHIFPLVATRHPAAPWLRPPLRNLDVVEDFLRTLLEMGFTEEQAVATYRAFTSFLLGQLLLTVAEQGAPTVMERPGPGGSARAGAGGAGGADSAALVGEYPIIVGLRETLSADHAAEEFETALEVLLDRIEVLLGG